MTRPSPDPRDPSRDLGAPAAPGSRAVGRRCRRPPSWFRHLLPQTGSRAGQDRALAPRLPPRVHTALEYALATLRRRHAARVARRAAERRAAAEAAHADALRVVRTAAHDALHSGQAELVVDASRADEGLPTIRLKPAEPDAARLEVVADADTTYVYVAEGHLRELMQRDLEPRHHELARCVAAVVEGNYVEERKPRKRGQVLVMTFTTPEEPIVVRHFSSRDPAAQFGRRIYPSYCSRRT